MAQDISQRRRFWLLLAAWAVAAIATAVPNPGILRYAWLFPNGLIWFVVPSDWHPDRGVVPALLVVGWISYATLTILGFRQSRSVRYLVYYAILCVLLLFNVVGCHMIISQPIKM